MPVSPEEIERQQKMDAMKLKLSELNNQLDLARLGGGIKRIEKEHAKGKPTAQERLNLLLDKGAPRLEIGALAGHGMYKEHGGCPGGGCALVIGQVEGVR